MVCPEEDFGAQHYLLIHAVVYALFVLSYSNKSRRPQNTAVALLALNSFTGLARGRGTYYFYIGQPALLCVCALVLYHKHGWLADVLGIAYLFGVVIITAAIDPCSTDYWVNVPDGLAALYLCSVAAFNNALYPAFCLTEAAGLGILFVTATKNDIILRAEHLTWWSIMFFGLWGAVRFMQYIINENSVGTSDVDVANTLGNSVWVLNVIVLVGVWFMSASKCDLLQDALEDAGAPLYIAGNFLMHYYPVLRTTFGVRATQDYDAAIAKGAGIAVIYSLAYPATQVYGCTFPPEDYTAIAVATVALFLAFVFVAWHYLRKHGRGSSSTVTSGVSGIKQ